MTPSSRRLRLGSRPPLACFHQDALDVLAVAWVAVSSEHACHRIEHAFDGTGGPGGSCWIASEPGEQVVTLFFDAPQPVRVVSVESEECSRSRTQTL